MIEFFEHLLRHPPGKLLIIWDGLPSHRSRLVWDFVRHQRGRLWLEFLPPRLPSSMRMRRSPTLVRAFWQQANCFSCNYIMRSSRDDYHLAAIALHSA